MLKENALLFALNAHKGQIRKCEPEKPFIVHPLTAGKILEEYNASEEAIAAGYLHDVVEDTEYTIEDIEIYFGKHVADLVWSASEPDNSLPWDERKQRTINTIWKLPLENKMIICADKISNLEDLNYEFMKAGKKDFSKFKRGYDKQKWYYENIYKSLICRQDPNFPMFVRLKQGIEKVFGTIEEKEFIESVIFEDNKDKYNILKELDLLKFDTQRIRNIVEHKPIVVEIAGTPKIGQTNLLSHLNNFFTKSNFKVKVIENSISSKKEEQIFLNSSNKLDEYHLQIKITEKEKKELIEFKNEDYDIILVEKSITDSIISAVRLYLKGVINQNQLKNYINYYSKFTKNQIDFTVLLYSESINALRREYMNSLSLDYRNSMTEKSFKEYNEAIKYLLANYNALLSDVYTVNTSNSPFEYETSIANKILTKMRSTYLNDLKKI